MGNTKGMSRDIYVTLTQGAVSIKILGVVRRLDLRLDLLSTLGTLPRERDDSTTGTRCTNIIKRGSSKNLIGTIFSTFYRDEHYRIT